MERTDLSKRMIIIPRYALNEDQSNVNITVKRNGYLEKGCDASF